MKLRKLKIDDAPLILEWMKDPDLYQFFRFDPQKTTMQTVTEFIVNSQDDKHNLHYAITENGGEYLGTISLKNIDEGCCEYAVALRKTAISKGYGTLATKAIFDVAFNELNLDEIKLFVLRNNTRAIKMYVKNGFEFVETLEVNFKGEQTNLDIYSIIKSKFENK